MMKKLPAALILVLGASSFGAIADEAKQVMQFPVQQPMDVVSGCGRNAY
ncbi:MAG: hypothetical protein ACL7AX_00640 [Candidatus Arsenophonus phytopathogenicus]